MVGWMYKVFLLAQSDTLWYNMNMTAKLTDELRQAIASQQGKPVKIEDPVSHVQYVLIELDDYEQLQRATELDMSDPNPRDFYPAFVAAVKDDLDAPGMELYDDPTKQS